MSDKSKLFNDESAYTLLKKAQLHLLLIPHFIFLVSGMVAIFLALEFHDYKIILLGYLIAIVLSQLYWSRMVVVWKLKAFKHQLFRTVYREAINEMLIYPDSNWFNNLIIATPSEKTELNTKPANQF